MFRFLLKFLLFPFALLYDLVTKIRNLLYINHIFRSESFSPFIVSVGNLTVGGTGKTPHVEYLIAYFIKLLGNKRSDNKQVTFLSRGYGRSTKGVIIAAKEPSIAISAATIGDEPMQIFSKFGKCATIAVGEKRVLAIPQILSYAPQTQVIILDDAYQHRAVQRDVNILLTDYYRPFYKDFLLPMGRLRESRKGAKRADIVIVTKCPQTLQSTEKEAIKKNIQVYTNKDIPIFFSTFRYGEQLPLFADMNTLEERAEDLILVTGIADTTALVASLQQQYHIVKHFQFADHFQYTESAIYQIIREYQTHNAKKKCRILTTEKDKMKLLVFKDLLKEIPFFYLPIEVVFLEREEEFLLLTRLGFSSDNT